LKHVFTPGSFWRNALFLFGLSGCLIAEVPKQFPVTDSHMYFSPYNTYSDGSGRMLPTNIHGGSTFALWNHAGSYLKTGFTGSSATLLVDASTISEGGRPRIKWSIDNGPMRTASIMRDQRSVELASGLPLAPHTLAIHLAATDANFDRWQSPMEAVKIEGIRLDSRGELVSPSGSTAILPSNIVFFGDSITEGAWVLGNSDRLIAGHWVDWVDRSDATAAWPGMVAAALGAEFGNCGWGGMSWINPVRGAHIPALPKAWDFYFSDHSRLINGKLSPIPEYVIVNMGTNDGNRDTTEAVREWLKAIRRAVNERTPVFVVIPFGQQNRERLVKAVEGANDRFVLKIDLGPRWAYGLNHYGTPSAVAYDGLHPKESASGLYAALVAAAIQKALQLSASR
jgi:lysophospholipase L1-like esterase